ncbi:DUF1961 family protein [Flavobacterium seoulense]|uniref:3-keto-disaccharide hydrolase domain-containing protein n=1 Tax=Flavobacterium seoulense TaxID=1492738 RepID=A0A066WL76_9FLAO|nr:DUF1961 family protein [Flavobacterium seoulense]KDN54772.1 hypothetical protein FEM21_21540 [Flavobacterium seoulense]
MNVKSFLFSLNLFLTVIVNAQNTDNREFEILNQSKHWQLQLKDKGTKDWQTKWFLDGLEANIKNTKAGMLFNAGTTAGTDTAHAVLWTKQSFKGNLKIEYNFTRKDTETKWAIILYLQATGIGNSPYVEDISKWNQLRTIPAMKTYFNNMKALHISYSSFENDNNDPEKDYIRVRQYPVIKGQNFNTTTEIPNAFFETELFKTDENYKITVIKTAEKLYFKVTGKDTSKLFSWNLQNDPELIEGRIGLRQMATRSALYKNISVYTMN